MAKAKDTYEQICTTCAVQLLLAECTDGVTDETFERIAKRFGKFARKMPTFHEDVMDKYEAIVCGY